VVQIVKAISFAYKHRKTYAISYQDFKAVYKILYGSKPRQYFLEWTTPLSNAMQVEAVASSV